MSTGKMKTIVALGLLLLCYTGTGQERMKGEAVRVTYRQVVNGQEGRRGGGIELLAGREISETRGGRQGQPGAVRMAEEKEILDHRNKTAYQMASLADPAHGASGVTAPATHPKETQRNGVTRFHIKTPFSDFPGLTLTGEKETILGYSCEKATTTLRSNSIEIWFTRDLPFRGTPQMAYGIPDGLVLKIVRNQNFALVADTLRFVGKNEAPVLPDQKGEEVDQALYRHKITESLITTVEIFRDEQISWGNAIQNPAGEVVNATYKYAGGTVILRKVILPEAAPGDQIFAELLQYSNGDAYDRTGTVFMIPAGKKRSFLDALRNGVEEIPFFTARNGKNYQGMTATGDYLPPVELMRFFTPFGVRHFNEQVKVYGQVWEEAAWYKQEVTDLQPLLRGEVWIGVFIGNYDKGGHKVSLSLKYYPGAPQPRETRPDEEPQAWVMPLFNTLNIMEMAGQNYGTLFDTDSLTVEFEVPEGVKNLKLRYLTTGHGGWGGGDEFNQKENRIFIDGQLVVRYTPWRTDCGHWRKYNPASGNFWNGVTSSDYSRSGWCPGSATDPLFVPLENLSPGRHILKVAIPQGAPEGGSFSAWCVSGLLTGEF